MKHTLIFLGFLAITLGAYAANATITEGDVKRFCDNVPDNYVMNRFRQPNGDKAEKSVLWLKGDKKFSNGVSIEVFDDKKHYVVILPSGDAAGGCTRQQLSELLVENHILPEELGGRDKQLEPYEMKFLYVNDYDLIKYYPGERMKAPSKSSKSSTPQPVESLPLSD